MITIEFGVVYKIENIVNHRVYIGQTKNFNRRKKCHLENLRLGCHFNTNLQDDYNKFGSSNFTFDILEYENHYKTRIKKETFWINYYGGMNSNKVYNQVDNLHNCQNQIEATIISNKTRKLKDSTLQKMSSNNKGENNPFYNHRKYNDELIGELKILKDSGLTYNQLEKQFGISSRVIRNLILFGRRTNPKVSVYKKAKRKERRENDNY